MATSSALPEALKAITATKIAELKKQRAHFESEKSSILAQAKGKDLLTRIGALLTGSSRLEGFRASNSSDEDSCDEQSSTNPPQLTNKRLFLAQAKADPSFPKRVLQQLETDLLISLELKGVKHQQCQFFSELVTEWLSNPDGARAANTVADSSYEAVGRKEMHTQQAQWEELVFNAKNIDLNQISQYLQKLFNLSKTVTNALDDLRRDIRKFSFDLQSNTEIFDASSLQTTIKGLLATDLLSEEKSAILKTFLTNKEVAKEVADVLNMRMASLDTWKWSTVNGAISVDMRRQLNGKYRVFMDEDVLDALLLHTLGVKWSVRFKNSLATFFNSYAWNKESKLIPKADRERREYFLGNDQGLYQPSVQSKRKLCYGNDYFMAQLPTEESEGPRAYDDDNDEDDGLSESRKSPLQVKHSLLHLLIAELLIARHLHPDRIHTIVRSDFKWFGPSLPHSSVFAVLEFFGVTETWISFFRKFLEAPLRFTQDGPKSQVRVRRCGVPMSHALSDLFGEVLLFVMDFAVNQAVDGSVYLYRLHDDFWFWGGEEVCGKAWKAMTTFATTVSIEFNDEKTGTVKIKGDMSREEDGDISDSDTSDSSLDANDTAAEAVTNLLPKGEIRWGFLRLDADSRRFVVDQTMVNEHIVELQVQLSQCNSVFSYVQAYNAYLARFFSNNFGKPSHAFGRDHIDMTIETFARIQKTLFPYGSVTDHLRDIIKKKFGVNDLPDGFFYWPIQMGGLELRNPFIPLFAMRASLRRSPARLLEKALERDEAEYTAAKIKFQNENTGRGLGKYNHEMSLKIENDGGNFMSKDEFLRYREERSQHLANVYDQLLEVPLEYNVKQTALISSWLEPLQKAARSKNESIQKQFDKMQPYWKWTLAVHGKEIVRKYGGVEIVDKGRVPLGVVSIMKAGKVRWQG